MDDQGAKSSLIIFETIALDHDDVLDRSPADDAASCAQSRERCRRSALRRQEREDRDRDAGASELGG